MESGGCEVSGQIIRNLAPITDYVAISPILLSALERHVRVQPSVGALAVEVGGERRDGSIDEGSAEW